MANLSDLVAASGLITPEGGTFTGGVTFSAVEETTTALSGTTPSLDLSAGTDFSLVTSGNTTVSVTNPPTGQAWVATLVVTLGGAHTLAITSADWGRGGAPSLASGDEVEITMRGVGSSFRTSVSWRSL